MEGDAHKPQPTPLRQAEEAASEELQQVTSTRRVTWNTLESVVSSRTATWDVQMGFNPKPGWTQQWRTVQRQLRRLRQQYSGEQRAGNEEMGETILALMIALWHLSDWLRHDDDTGDRLRAVLRDEATFSKYVAMNSRPLDICGGYANTAKHYRRRRPEVEMTARNDSFSARGPWMSITYGRGEEMQIIDALELAEQCAQAWRDLLSQHQVAVPAE